MIKENTNLRAQSRGDSGFARVMTIMAMLFIAATGAWADNWTNIVKNSNMEGTDASCFYVKENALTSEKVFIARITDGIGKDGSRAIKVTTDCNEANDWDTQFFIRLPYELPAGTKYRISFDYKSNKAKNSATSFQCAKEPGQYIIWYMDASQPSFEFTADWKHFDGEFTIPTECNGTQSDDGSYLKIFQTFAVSLAQKNSEVTEYIFDNVKVEIDASVLTGLTEHPATAPDFLRVYPDPNHQHNFSYNANGATITATCTEGCTIFDPMTLTISAPKNLLFNYQKKEATLNADYNKTAFPGEIAIDYYQGTTKLNGAPIHTGDYTAKVTIGGQTASVDFTINGQTPIRFIKKMKLGNGYAYQVSTLTEYLPVESTNDYCILLDGRTYVVKGNVVLSKGLIYNGSLNLLVCDKAKLTVKGGIWHVGSQLDIYAEEGAEQTATIDVQGDTSIELEGIANQPALSGNIVLNSGKLTATPAAGGKLAADDLELTIASGVSGDALTGGTLQDDGSMKFTAAQVNSLARLTLTTPATNGVKLASDTEDADNWTISDGTSEAKGTATLPNVAEGTTVTATYSGTKHVKKIKAKVVSKTIDLSQVTVATTVEDGYTITGTLNANVQISIADGATVTLSDVSINSGLKCNGNATIVLAKGTKNIISSKDYTALIVGPAGTTLTIEGEGQLNATGGGDKAGIGSQNKSESGNIVINGGIIEASASFGAAIGAADKGGKIGDITINGGKVTATQTGSYGAGIGSGSSYDGGSTCGNITITGGEVVADGGMNAAPGIGAGGLEAKYNSTCGNITITGGKVTAKGGNYAAGIGTGANSQGSAFNSSCGNITISGGTVIAQKGEGATYDVGPGNNGQVGTVNVTVSVKDKNNNDATIY